MTFPSPPARAWLASALLAILLVAACDDAFQPLKENESAPFSIFGYLDLNADTQWVRVMPVREKLLLDDGGIDASVTLQKVGGGPVIALRDSLFTFPDDQLGGVAYAHNFWTTARLEPSASYRLKALRADGDSTTAVVVMPAEVDLSFRINYPSQATVGTLQVRAENVLFVDVMYLMANSCGAGSLVRPIRQKNRILNGPPFHAFVVRVDSVGFPCESNLNRHEIRVVAASSDWPYLPTLTDLAVGMPGRVASNVENGLGFVAGVAIRTIPFFRCEVIVPTPDRTRSCDFAYDVGSASLSGRVIRPACANPSPLADVRLREELADGHVVVRSWRAGLDGAYRFEGIEPGSRIGLELVPGVPAATLPRLAPGQRYTVPDITLPSGC
jgi:hypothetical protein